MFGVLELIRVWCLRCSFFCFLERCVWSLVNILFLFSFFMVSGFLFLVGGWFRSVMIRMIVRCFLVFIIIF